MRDADRQPTAFGWYLLRRMSDAGYTTQIALARAAHVSKSAISRWIYEEGRPEQEGLRSVAHALHVDVDEVLAAAGYGSVSAEVAATIAAMRPDPIDPLLAEAARILAADAVPEQEKAILRGGIDRLMDRSRPFLRRRHRSA